MPGNTYLPLKYAENMNMETLASFMKKAAWSYAGNRKGSLNDRICGEISAMDAGDALAFAGDPLFFTDAYKGRFRNLHEALMKGKHFNGKNFGRTPYDAEWRDIITMSAVCDRWSENRQVYEFDPDFARELTDTRELSLYPEILRRVPYDTFYIEHGNMDAFSPVNGAFVNIRVFPDDGMEFLICRVVKNMYLTGRYRFVPEDAEKDGTFTCYRFDKNLIRHREDIGTFLYTDGKEKRKFVDSAFEDMAAFYFQAISYLCSRKPDVTRNAVTRKIHVSAKSGKSSVNDITQIQKWDVGLYYGKVIRTRVMESAEDAETGDGKKAERTARTGTRKPVRPHCRCAHWHHYRTGKGRTRLEIRWIQPSFVCADPDNMPVRINRVEK